MVRVLFIAFMLVTVSMSSAQVKISLYFVEKNPLLTNSVEDLQSALEKSLGYCPLIESTDTLNQIVIETSSSEVRQSELLRLGKDGFIIRTIKGNRLIITGNTDIGTEFGVYYFLEKYLGVKWLFPGENWENIPTNHSFRIPSCNDVVIPDFKTRWLAPINTNQKNDIGLWGRHLKLIKDVEYNHNLFKIFEGTEEFLPIVKGKKIRPKSNTDQTWQPNFAAEGASWFSHNYLKRYFKDNPTVSSFSLSINDSQVFDDAITSNIVNHQGLKDYSDQYYTWVKQTVDETNRFFPGKTYGVLAYNNVITPPRFRLPNNVVPFITFERLRWVDPVLRHKDMEISKKWASKVKEVGWYDYTYGLNYIVPRPYFTVMGEYLKYGYKNNVLHYTTELYTNVLEGPKAWIMSQLLWDTTLSPERLLDDWCTGAVGKEASSDLKAFYKLWEAFWNNKVVDSKWWELGGTAYLHFNNLSYINHISVDDMNKADELLANTLLKVKTDIQRFRIEEIINVWELSKMNYVYFTKSNLKTLSSQAVTKNAIMKKLEEVGGNPLNGSLVHYSKRFNKY